MPVFTSSPGDSSIGMNLAALQLEGSKLQIADIHEEVAGVYPKVMIDGKMQDDATWKQCKVMINLAEMLARKDHELAELYGLEPAGAGA